MKYKVGQVIKGHCIEGSPFTSVITELLPDGKYETERWFDDVGIKFCGPVTEEHISDYERNYLIRTSPLMKALE